MIRKISPILAIAILAFLAVPKLVAEDDQSYPVSWDSVPGAGGYRIELQNGSGDTLVSRTVGNGVLDYTFHLQPGSYRFRVTTLSVAMLDEGATEWFPIVVEPLSAPQVTAIQPNEIQTDKSRVVILIGRHFAKQIKAQLVDPDGNKSLLRIQKFSIDKMQLIIPPLKQAGDYGILLTNSAKFATLKGKALRVRYPAPVFGSLRPAIIRLGVDETNFSFSAEKLATGAKVAVMPHGVDPSVAADALPITATVGENGFQATLDSSAAAGDYDVYVVNHSDEAPILVGTLSLVAAPKPASVPLPQPVATPPAQSAAIASPSSASTAKPAPIVASAPAAVPSAPIAVPAEPATVPPAPAATAKPKTEGLIRKVLVGAGWQYSLPLNKWGSIYSDMPRSALLRIDCFLTPFERPASGSAWDYAVGFDSRYAGFSKFRIFFSRRQLALELYFRDRSVGYLVPTLDIDPSASRGRDRLFQPKCRFFDGQFPQHDRLLRFPSYR